MTAWLSRRICHFRNKNKGSACQRMPSRLALEALEDRFMPATGFVQVNLASDVPGLARVTDPNLVNPWGISLSPTGPFWVANNGSGVSNLLDGSGNIVPLVVTIPGAVSAPASPTGTVFNPGAEFVVSANGLSASGQFLFDSEDGTISAWAPSVNPVDAIVAVDNSALGAVYKGLALATDASGRTFLLAADFGRGTVDAFDENFRPVQHPGAFQDPSLPAGFAPFNIENVNNDVFVTYARQNSSAQDDVAGSGQGYIDEFSADGELMRRFASGGPLNAPWGLALAPAGFGALGNTLLVGNNGDGRINAFDLGSGSFLGPVAQANGTAIVIPGLWDLAFGNGHDGGDSGTLFFAAGIAGGNHGLFGAIQAPQEAGRGTGGTGGFDPSAPGERRDYPLPPTAGPALQGSGTDNPVPIALLLPITESSLGLAPTSTAISETRLRVERPTVQAASVMPVSYVGSATTIGDNGAGDSLNLNSTEDLIVPDGPVSHSIALGTAERRIESRQDAASAIAVETSGRVEGATSALQVACVGGFDEPFGEMEKPEAQAMLTRSDPALLSADDKEPDRDLTSVASAGTPFSFGSTAKLSADVFVVIAGVTAWSWVHAGRSRPRRNFEAHRI